MGRVRHLLMKELIQLRRDKRLLRILLAAPALQLLLLGFAATTDVRRVDLAVQDYDRSRLSREYVRSLRSSGYLEPTYISCDPDAADLALVSGKASVVLVIPRGFERRLVRCEPASVQALVDGSDSNFATHGMNYLKEATTLFSRRLVTAAPALYERPRGPAGPTKPAASPPASTTAGRAKEAAWELPPTATFETRVWYNPDLKSRNYMVPGVMGVLLLVTTMVVTSMALVREREEGTIEQVIVTPIRVSELIAGKLLPFVAIGFVEITLALVIIVAVFRVPLEGSVGLLYLLSGLFLLSTLGLGLFISALVKTQQQAMMVATFFVMIPFILLSGFTFPVENMPPVIQAVAHLIPLKYYLTIVRGIFLKSAGWTDLWKDALVLLGWGGGIFALAVASFRKQLG